MSEHPDIRPGDVFAGRYEVETDLADGNRKRTYLALDTKTDRKVALSVVKSEAMPHDPEGTQREARVLGRIGSHDNIVSLYDYDEESDPQYTVFEYLPGGTLADVIRNKGPLPPEEVLRLGRQVCRGLAHLHSRGLLHRDVTPRNVLLDERGNAHLGDFDSAISLDEQLLRPPLTMTAYTAQEELTEQALDVRSDLFSLGGVLYVLATGADPPLDSTLLRGTSCDLTTSYAELVEALMAKEPLSRPDSAETVLKWLEDIRHMSNIDALIAAGEGSGVEFKSSLRHPYPPLEPSLQHKIEKMTPKQAEGEIEKALRCSVTKTIAAFLNSEGGTLLIGVSDKGDVLGIEADFQHLKEQNVDYWYRDLKQAVANALGDDIWASIRPSLVSHGEETLAVIHCPSRGVETWHRSDGKDTLFVRAGPTTVAIEGPDLLKYVREHWPH